MPTLRLEDERLVLTLSAGEKLLAIQFSPITIPLDRIESSASVRKSFLFGLSSSGTIQQIPMGPPCWRWYTRPSNSW